VAVRSHRPYPLRIFANLYVLAQEPWEVLSFLAIAEADAVRCGAVHRIETIWGLRCRRRQGEVLHPDRELEGHLNYAAARTAD